MDWHSEEHLVDDFITSSIKFFDSSKLNSIVIRELKTGYGRPDVVLIQYTKETPLRKDFCNPLSQLGSYAISFLSSRPWVRPDRLGGFLNISKKKQNEIIEELDNHELIVRGNNLIKSRPKSEILGVKRVLTFEAKLQNWREAVNQAERHLWFTNESYVLMPCLSDKIINNISNECAKRGLGLCIYDPLIGLRTMVKPHKKGIRNTPFIWSINDKLREVNNDTKSFFSRL